MAVESFLAEELAFNRIPEVIERVLAAHDPAPVDCLDAVLEADGRARALAREVVAGRC